MENHSNNFVSLKASLIEELDNLTQSQIEYLWHLVKLLFCKSAD
jgi:hypothetical protein|nr:MAG TPA: DARPIN 44C12V5 SCAFFOLD, CYTOKINE-DE NOVO PROTEIN.6A [Caudoviricetes sp.]